MFLDLTLLIWGSLRIEIPIPGEGCISLLREVLFASPMLRVKMEVSKP